MIIINLCFAGGRDLWCARHIYKCHFTLILSLRAICEVAMGEVHAALRWGNGGSGGIPDAARSRTETYIQVPWLHQKPLLHHRGDGSTMKKVFAFRQECSENHGSFLSPRPPTCFPRGCSETRSTTSMKCHLSPCTEPGCGGPVGICAGLVPALAHDTYGERESAQVVGG